MGGALDDGEWRGVAAKGNECYEWGKYMILMLLRYNKPFISTKAFLLLSSILKYNE